MKEITNKMTAAFADQLMEDGFHCSQCVFPYAAQRLGMDSSQAYRLSAALGGGCFRGDSCGAVTGAILALGMVYGFDAPNSEEADEQMVAKIHEFEDRFEKEHGAFLCRQLLGGFDMANRDDEAPEGTFDNCARYCETACRILDEMISNHYIR